jgi:hypothetical protein
MNIYMGLNIIWPLHFVRNYYGFEDDDNNGNNNNNNNNVQ